VKGGAREVALRVFLEWDASRHTADALLAKALESTELAPRDHDLAFELVRGVFRWRGRLDWQLAALVHRPLDDLHPPILWTLRLGLYQLEHLDRVPAHAAVATSVELAKRYGHKGSAALVNAVLRAAPKKLGNLAEPDAAADPAGHLAARTSHPRWILERWLARYGFARTLRLAARATERPALTLRAVGERASAADLLADLRAAGIRAEPGLMVPETVRIEGGWHPRVREILDAGLALVQDEGAALVAIVARPHEGASILDVCAAPGGKAMHVAQLGGASFVVAADVSYERLRRLDAARRRTERAGMHLLVADGRRPATRGGFSRVLVDAPCTNSGVFARRPDAKWRRAPEDLPRLARLQGELLDASRGQVGPGGLLVYSTCSLEPEENEEVIRGYLERHPSDSLVSARDVLPEELCRGEFLCTNPSELPIDGTFAAVLRPGGKSFPTIPRS
jgi:16S rRNA (cytosine967-C5)-methyltransferase